MKTLLETIKEADPVEIDGCFCCLRDRKLGILRKLKVFALILDIEEDVVLNEAPKDAEGRYLDYQSRHIISDALVARSQQQKHQNN